MMASFEICEPITVEEAFDLVDPEDPSIRPIGGGTALMLMMKAQIFKPQRLVSLCRINGQWGSSPPSMRSCLPSMTKWRQWNQRRPRLPSSPGRRASRICSGRFCAGTHVRSQQTVHTPLEPFVMVADVSDGRATIHTASQGPSFVRIEIARLLGWPEDQVRVKVPYLGGGFRRKAVHQAEPHFPCLWNGQSRFHHLGRAVLHGDAPPVHVQD